MKSNSNNSIFLHMKGYDRVRAIYKLKQSIKKFGDKLGRKNKLLNKIKRKDEIGHDFINLTINRLQPKNSRPNIFFNLFQNKDKKTEEKFKNDSSKEESKNKGFIGELNYNKTKNELEVSNNSFDINLKDAGFESLTNRKKNSDQQTLVNDYSNFRTKQFKKLSLYKIIKNFKKMNISNNETYSNENNDNPYISPLNKKICPINYYLYNHKNEIKNNIDSYLRSSSMNKNLKPLIENRKNPLKFRNFKLGTNPPKMKVNYNIIKLGRNFSLGNVGQSDSNINSRLLFYKKYKKKKEMKLTKSNISKSQGRNNDGEGEGDSSHTGSIGSGYIRDQMMKKLEQQTIHNDSINKKNKPPITYNRHYYKKIPTYVRLPNINKISFPKIKIRTQSNCDNSNINNSYFYVKDEKNNSINKVFMINPFIRNKIIDNLIYSYNKYKL